MGTGSQPDCTLATLSVVSGWAAVVTKRVSVTIWILLGQAGEWGAGSVTLMRIRWRAAGVSKGAARALPTLVMPLGNPANRTAASPLRRQTCDTTTSALNMRPQHNAVRRPPYIASFNLPQCPHAAHTALIVGSSAVSDDGTPVSDGGGQAVMSGQAATGQCAWTVTYVQTGHVCGTTTETSGRTCQIAEIIAV
ncbi:hypothetical protein COCVIDRAFT_16221 [Bipolaris victoriae FI3]|uniref:Uncharacterized protein n=1 Tax=Bipolaris victoriae (strain FI3) TaxID=930091 RepID=W7EIS8_BIPV3|nr:hypothetical protein COCVIDRAFT_16221 [Bipolaris victoriae FI3]